MNAESFVFPSADGTKLEAELCIPDNARFAVVLSHPHPKHQGNMKSIIPSTLFAALPSTNAAVLRFNFRGIGNSEGEFSDGIGEVEDLGSAIGQLHEICEGLPLVVAGWSFGADMALCLDDGRINGYFLVAPPLREQHQSRFKLADDPRPKWFIIPERDQFRSPNEVRHLTMNWQNVSVDVIPGADHFLVGRTDSVVQLCIDKLVTLTKERQ